MEIRHQRSRRPWRRQVLTVACGAASLLFLALLPLSFRFYTTLGIDSEQWERPGRVYARYCRIRWPGDGSFRIGGGGTHYGQAAGGKPLQIFDLGGRFFQPPRRDVPRSLWNRLGFWWIVRGLEEGDASAGAWQVWVGMPSILPPVLLAIATLLCVRTRRGKP